MPPTLRVLSYNIHKGFSFSRRRFVLSVIREAIRLVHPDLVFLQEVVGAHNGFAQEVDAWPMGPQFEFLADEQWPHYAYGRNAVYRQGHHGNAILSKYPLLGWGNLDISQHRLEQRGMLHAELELPDSGTRITPICTHLGLFHRGRARQLEQMSQWISANVDAKQAIILAGDFNDWRGHASSSQLQSLGCHDVFRATHGRHVRTFPSFLPLLTLDRIYVRGLAVRRCEALSGEPWNKLSDHLALFAELEPL